MHTVLLTTAANRLWTDTLGHVKLAAIFEIHEGHVGHVQLRWRNFILMRFKELHVSVGPWNEVQFEVALQRVSASSLKLWVTATKEGTIVCGHYTCMAGLGEACSHVAALLFALEWNTQHQNMTTCTYLPCLAHGCLLHTRAWLIQRLQTLSSLHQN